MHQMKVSLPLLARRRPAWLTSALLHLALLQALILLTWSNLRPPSRPIVSTDAPVVTALLEPEPENVLQDAADETGEADSTADSSGGTSGVTPTFEELPVLTAEPTRAFEELEQVRVQAVAAPEPAPALETVLLETPAPQPWKLSKPVHMEEKSIPASTTALTQSAPTPSTASAFAPAGYANRAGVALGAGSGIGTGGTGNGSGSETSGQGLSVGAPGAAHNTGNLGTGSGHHKAKPISTPGADYPQEAKRLGLSGTVVVSLEVLPTGKVGHVELAKSSGIALLDNAVLQASRGWRFQPAEENNIKVSSIVRIAHTFDLQ